MTVRGTMAHSEVCNSWCYCHIIIIIIKSSAMIEDDCLKTGSAVTKQRENLMGSTLSA